MANGWKALILVMAALMLLAAGFAAGMAVQTTRERPCPPCLIPMPPAPLSSMPLRTA
jgi:hypothetical protein